MSLLRPLIALLLVVAPVLAQEGGFYRVPEGRLSFDGGAITILGDRQSDTFVPGIGWTSGSDAQLPLVRDGEVYLDAGNAQRLGLAGLPAASPPGPTPDGGSGRGLESDRQQPQYGQPQYGQPQGVRFGGDVEIRVVVDLPQLADARQLSPLEGSGELESGQALSLRLPVASVLGGEPEPYRGIEVELSPLGGGTLMQLRGPEMSYRVFALESPTRLVIDLVPVRETRFVATAAALHDGVTYRTFGAHTPAGESLVHLLEIAPGAGEFRVVGTSEVPRTLSELADGAFAAINAGYFDTSTYQAIGLLQVDYGLLSLPSRNRASVGFGIAGPVVTRVSARVQVRVDGSSHWRTSGPDGVEVFRAERETVGTPRRGAVVVQSGRVVANRIGPVTVPRDGFVLTYPPDDRELALVDPGAHMSLGVQLQPDSFRGVRYAVEAGPLLVQDGLPAFNPELEQFARGQRILDVYTQQAAIGVRRDGTVLLLVADAMRAEDLVPLFLALGAEDAMRLDSGSSATLYADGRVLNRSSERRIVSAIVFLPGS